MKRLQLRWKAIAAVLGAVLPFLATGPGLMRPAGAQETRAPATAEPGTCVVYQADSEAFLRRRLAALAEQLRAALDADPDAPAATVALSEETIELTPADAGQADALRGRLAALLSGEDALGGLAVLDGGEGVVRIGFSAAGRDAALTQLRSDTVAIVERRLEAAGIAGAATAGGDELMVIADGAAEALQAVVGRPADFGIYLVAGEPGTPPAPGKLGLPQLFEAAILPVEPEPFLTGADVAEADAGTDQFAGQPVVTIRFTPEAATRLGAVTAANINGKVAIVLDGTVLSAPIIREPVLGGSAQISGNFTVPDAENLALLLRAGSLPVPLALVAVRPRDECKPFDTTGPPGAG